MLAIIGSLIIAIVICWFCYSSMKPVSKATTADNYFEKDINLSLKTDTFLRTEKKRKKDD